MNGSFIEAYYWSVPCLFNPHTNEIKGKTIATDILLDLFIWIDRDVLNVDSFKIRVKDD